MLEIIHYLSHLTGNLNNNILHSGSLLGYIFIFLIIFAESGLLIGFFLPGDSLLFSLGLAAAHGYPHILLLLLVGSAGAILGDSVGYLFGQRVGPTLFSRNDSLLFKKKDLHKAHEFYEEHGKETILLARFTPIIRTFAPIVAGSSDMAYHTFLIYNILGGIGWVTSISLIGYFLGNVIPNIDHYILPIVVVIVILSAIPPVLEYLKHTKKTV
jgi:membrane-associated protein